MIFRFFNTPELRGLVNGHNIAKLRARQRVHAQQVLSVLRQAVALTPANSRYRSQPAATNAKPAQPEVARGETSQRARRLAVAKRWVN